MSGLFTYGQKKVIKNGKNKMLEVSDLKEKNNNIFEKYVLFHDTFGKGYIQINTKTSRKIYDLEDSFLKRLIRTEYYERYGKMLSKTKLNNAFERALDVAIIKGKMQKLSVRLASDKENIWYDLSRDDGLCVKINTNGWRLSAPPILFYNRSRGFEQVLPSSKNRDLTLLRKYINVDEDTYKLLLIYLVTALIPEIQHTIPVIYGTHGSGKTTLTKIFKRLIDPSNAEIVPLPFSSEDMSLQFHHNHMICYDNISTLNQNQSDMLCMAATGGAITKRKLFKNLGMVTVNLFCCPILNGVNLSASAPDLLDRALIIELGKIKNGLKSERNMMKEFEQDRPAILSGLFDLLSKAMNFYDNVPDMQLPRMADFTKWGYAIAEVADMSGEEFLKIYENNRKLVHSTVMDSEILLTVISEFLKEHGSFEGMMRNLLTHLYSLAVRKNICDPRELPLLPNNLSRKMKYLEPSLENIGITCSTKRKATGSHITLTFLRN